MVILSEIWIALRFGTHIYVPLRMNCELVIPRHLISC